MFPSRSRPDVDARVLAASALVSMFALAAPASAIGILVPTAPEVSALDLVHHRVEVEVTERGARTKVTQEFKNNTGRQLEATYMFPLPKGATVDEFALWMNGKRETGKVMERQKAREIYESIVRRARDPGLIEYVDAELFQARVFPIPPNGTQKVELIFSHLVDYENGVHRYVYPLKTDARASSTLEDFTMTVKVKSKLPIRNLYSPSHRVAARAKGNTGVASFERSAFSLADDFSLYWTVDDKDVGLTVLTYKADDDDAGYFLLLASPKDGFREKEIIGKRVSFVVDTSGSMTGEKMDATREALDYCLKNLGEDDLFNVITFGGYVESFDDKMLAASADNVRRAREFVKNIEPMGGTNIDDALNTALTQASGSKKAPHLVVFLTDGRPTVGETDVTKILDNAKAKNVDAARMFVFGVGEDVNTILLDRLAEEGGGHATYTRGDASIAEALTAFWNRISHPVLSDLSLKVDGVRVFGNHPRRLPDLFMGAQLAVLGRYRGEGKATVTLQGTTPKGSRAFTYNADFANGSTEHSFIPRLWAQRQVGMLLAEVRAKGENPGLVEEITQLATRFGIVTPYTSYLVVEEGAVMRDEERRLGRPLPPPVSRPVGTVPGSTGGGGFGAPAADTAADDFGVFAPEPEAAAAPMKGEGGARPHKKASRGGAFKSDSGKVAVEEAKEIGRLQQSTVASERKVVTTVARALGRDFVFKDGAYVDAKSSPKDKTLRIKAYSDAFFAVLKLRPELKDALKLGEQVRVSVGKGRTLVIAPDGKERVSEGELKAFLAR